MPLPIEIDPAINGSVLAFALAVTAASVAVFGLVPAMQGSLSSAAAALKEGDLLARVRDLPGVEAATVAAKVPLGFGGTGSFLVQIDGYTPAANEQIDVSYNRVGSDYMRTMGVGLVSGRDFTDRDTPDLPDVGVVNETLARRYFAGRDPVGGRIRVGTRTLQIVGVARDGKYALITESPRPFLYVAADQWYRPDAVLIVKTAGSPAPIARQLHDVVRSLDTNVPLFDLRTVAQHLEIASFMQRMMATLLGVFGALALLLAAVGLYGVVAAMAVQRTPEIGMRIALGVTRRDIVSLILRQGAGMAATGVGLAGALGRRGCSGACSSASAPPTPSTSARRRCC